MNTLLMGARGSGKTTIGRRLAERCDLRFVDLDERVLASFGESSVQAVWSARGEAAWRTAEADALHQVLAADEQVVALGGGTPMIPASRDLIRSEQRAGRARLVYLRCPPAELARRLQADVGDRPSLTGGDPAREIGSVLADRAPTYEALADLICDVVDRTEDEVVQWILSEGR